MLNEAQPVPECVPLFPLEAVLFPRALLPLHIFETRYRKMTADAIAGDGHIAIALLRPGYESLYHTSRAPIHATIGVGRIVAARGFADGTYNIVLRGACRAHLLAESDGRPYRLGRVRPLHDPPIACEHAACQARCELLSVLEDFAIPFEFRKPWQELARSGPCLGTVVDQICGTLPCEFSPCLRQNLLEETDPLERARLLIQYLKTMTEVARRRIRSATTTSSRCN